VPSSLPLLNDTKERGRELRREEGRGREEERKEEEES
jgi:hypothetical protein